MNGPSEPDQPDRPERPASEPAPRTEPWLLRLLRTTIAPPVLDDGGHDTPLSPRGRLVFWATVTVLVLGIAVLFVVSALK